MANYTHEYSLFPEQVYTPHNYMDADDQIGTLITQIKELQAQNKYVQAQRLIEKNKDVLSQYLLTTDAINAIEEETRNLEIYSKGALQSIYYGIEPDDNVVQINDVWIGD